MAIIIKIIAAEKFNVNHVKLPIINGQFAMRNVNCLLVLRWSNGFAA